MKNYNFFLQDRPRTPNNISDFIIRCVFRLQCPFVKWVSIKRSSYRIIYVLLAFLLHLPCIVFFFLVHFSVVVFSWLSVVIAFVFNAANRQCECVRANAPTLSHPSRAFASTTTTTKQRDAYKVRAK